METINIHETKNPYILFQHIINFCIQITFFSLGGGGGEQSNQKEQFNISYLGIYEIKQFMDITKQREREIISIRKLQLLYIYQILSLISQI